MHPRATPRWRQRCELCRQSWAATTSQCGVCGDRAPSDNSTLIDPATGELRDVEWTRDLGRLAWRVDGETYTKQYLPPMLDNLECPPEVLIREMDYAGVDVGLLHTYPLLGSPAFPQQLPRRRDEPVSRPPLQARHADRGRDTGRPGRGD